MRHFGAFEAKTHFSELLGDVMNGEKFVITKRGRGVAMIIPYTEEKAQQNPVENAIRALKKLRKGVRLGKEMTIRQMREQGRK